MNAGSRKCMPTARARRGTSALGGSRPRLGHLLRPTPEEGTL
ncbi:MULTISPECIES: hypothetical protein [unclassified Streptomyces]|nr:hypothetical protein [Streptomyces sp. NRRL WC-3618]